MEIYEILLLISSIATRIRNYNYHSHKSGITRDLTSWQNGKLTR